MSKKLTPPSLSTLIGVKYRYYINRSEIGIFIPCSLSPEKFDLTKRKVQYVYYV